MTEKEAIEILSSRRPGCGEKPIYPEGEVCEAYDMAIKALEEIQQYREIGTVKECWAVMEKQIPKKPDYEGDGCADGHMVYDTWICSNCGEHYEVDYDDHKCCPNCGQAIDWSEEG